jgi:hypothetical protein
MLNSLYSFKFISRKKMKSLKQKSDISSTKFFSVEEKNNLSKNTKEIQNSESGVDSNRRDFLKIASLTGLGLAASALFPKSTEAYVAGSTPTSNVVGSKDASNNRINPAKEDGNLATIAGKDFATQTTLAAMKAKTDLLTFDGSNNLLTASSGGASVVGIKDSTDVRINPAQDDSVVLLRRMVKLMESQAVVDTQMRQRVVVDTGAIVVSGSVTVATITSLSQLAGVDSRWQIIDWSRQAYNSGIRGNLINS